MELDTNQISPLKRFKHKYDHEDNMTEVAKTFADKLKA